MSYEENAARAALKRAREKAFPKAYEDERLGSAKRLAQFVINIADGVGYDIRKDPNDANRELKVIFPDSSGNAYVWLLPDATRGVVLGRHHPVGGDELEAVVPLRYDAAAEEWVGKGPEKKAADLYDDAGKEQNAVDAVVAHLITMLHPEQK